MIKSYTIAAFVYALFLLNPAFSFSCQAQEMTPIQRQKNALDKTQLDSFIQKNLPNAIVGILVQDPKTGKILYQYNANKTFVPASSLKVFTSAAAIQALGSDYQFNTFLYRDSDGSHPSTLNRSSNEKLENKSIKNLYIQFNGDPSLTSNDLKTLIINTFKKNKIAQISGKVIIDTTRFQAPDHAFGWSYEDLAWYFASPVTSVILDENAVKLRIISNKELGKKAEVSFAKNDLENHSKDGSENNSGNNSKKGSENNPGNNSKNGSENNSEYHSKNGSENDSENNSKTVHNRNYITLQSNLISVPPEIAETECSIQVSMDQKNSAVLSGCWPQNETPDTISLAVQNPTLIAEKIVRESLNELNIPWPNTIILGKVPSNAHLLASHSSKPLKELLQPILIDSNNLYAESLFKTLGVKKLGQGTFISGTQATKAILSDDFGLNADEFKIGDGSGNSRYTQISPIQMGMVLNKIYHSETLFPIFWELLPKWGQAGTLKSRKNESILTHIVRAKTGYMTGVSTLSGYITPNPDQTLIFVIMINNTLEKTSQLKEFQESLLLELLNQNFVNNTKI